MDFTQNLFLGIIDPEGITHTMFIALYLIPQRSKVDNIRIISDPRRISAGQVWNHCGIPKSTWFSIPRVSMYSGMYTPGTSLLCFVVQRALGTDGNLCVTPFENVLSNWTWLQDGTALDCMLRSTYLRHHYQLTVSIPVSQAPLPTHRQYPCVPRAQCCLSLPNFITHSALY